MRNQTNIKAIQISQCGAKANTASAHGRVRIIAHSPISNRAPLSLATDDSLLPVALIQMRVANARDALFSIGAALSPAPSNFNTGEANYA